MENLRKYADLPIERQLKLDNFAYLIPIIVTILAIVMMLILYSMYD